MQQFRFEVVIERIRSDRSGLPLSLVLIELPTSRATPADFDFLGRVLSDRLRITDSVGLISARCVGVLLPDTPEAGAWKVASEVCEVYPTGEERPDCDVYVYSDESDTDFGGTEEDAVESNAQPPEIAKSLFDRATPRTKRVVDIFGAMSGLILTAPLSVLIAVAIKATSRGPAIYAQEREGLGGRRFRIYKFRTMRLGADRQQSKLRQHSEQDGPAFKMSHDPRTTRIGRFLRRTSLDELPQLLNVLRGEMSLVGPRPLPTGESLQCARWQRRRLSVAPGMTCIWQIWGRNTVPFDEWMRMDLQYVRRRSLSYDLLLLLKTPLAIVLQRGPR
jgi:lipopolysaccharide/colanic/teichoic acid biosynthesis glycosyltransferase